MPVLSLTLISITAYTALAVVLKQAAGRTRADKVITVAVGTVALLAGVLATVYHQWNGTPVGALIAIAAGVIFFIASRYRLSALETAPVSLVFAITNLDLIISGIITMLIPFFGISVTLSRILAMLAAGAAILLGQRIKGSEKLPASVFISLALLSTSSMGYLVYAGFFAPLLFYIVLDHLAGFVLNINQLRNVLAAELAWGIAVGVCMFVGFWSLLGALSVNTAGMPLVLLALNMRTPITALLAVPLFKEQFSYSKLMAVALATLALVFWVGWS